MRDIFVCHASEDKGEVVQPLVEAFNDAGISCWYDEAEIKWGDSIIAKINEGLKMSRFVVVVMSPSFIQKNWPQREFDSVMNIEASSGEVKVLPLLVGTKKEQTEIINKFPLLNDKKYLTWDRNPDNIIRALNDRLGKLSDIEAKAGSGNENHDIPLPRIRKKFTQRDKDIFLRNSFFVIRNYFNNALNKAKQNDSDIEVDSYDVNQFKSVFTIYVRGDETKKCKIWIGGLSSSNAIAYSDGDVDINNDNGFNENLAIEDDGEKIGFNPLMGKHFYANDLGEGILTAEQAAKYLWLRFTERIR